MFWTASIRTIYVSCCLLDVCYMLFNQTHKRLESFQAIEFEIN